MQSAQTAPSGTTLWETHKQLRSQSDLVLDQAELVQVVGQAGGLCDMWQLGVSGGRQRKGADTSEDGWRGERFLCTTKTPLLFLIRSHFKVQSLFFFLLSLFPAEHPPPPPPPFCCLIIHLICEAPDAQTAAQGWGPCSTQVWQIGFCCDWCRINSSNQVEAAVRVEKGEEGRWKHYVKKEGG